MKRKFATVFLGVYLLSTGCFYQVMPTTNHSQGILDNFSLTPTSLGIMCISSAYPGLDVQMTDSRDNEMQADGDLTLLSDNTSKGGVPQESEAKDTAQKAEAIITSEEPEPEPVVFGDDPVVLILHTHATESYLPSSEGNYHKKGKANTVRDVGETLAETLKDNGIGVVHDQTLHDNPSYNQSYSRSYDTASALLKKYPTIECVIDLHRDAIASDSPAQVISVSGKNCAKYSYVVSNSVETAHDNLKFVKAMNKMATKDFAGFTGKVLERGYRYNQNLSSKYMLLEIGYNRNDIEESRNTAKVFGELLAKTLKAGY